MFKHIRKITSLLLVLALVTVSMGVFTVSAEAVIIDGLSSEELLTPSASSLYSINGLQAPAVLRNTLALYNINVDNDTLIEIIPSGTSIDNNALLVTTSDQTTIQKSLFIVFDEEGKIDPFPIPRGDAYSVNSGESHIFDHFNNGSFTIHASVQYEDLTTSGRFIFRPESALYVYYNSGNHSVGGIYMDYICCGFACTYPGLVDLGGGLTMHIISVNQANPVKNRIYSASNAYYANRALQVTGGGYHKITLTYTVDGDTETDDYFLRSL